MAIEPAWQPRKVQAKNEPFAQRPATRIWQETACAHNPYLAESCRCYGYDLEALAQQKSFVEVFYLLLRGELPSWEQAQLLEQLMILLINPGPRQAAARAAMNAGAGRTRRAHILPIALMVQGGAHLGGAEVEASMRFLMAHQADSPEMVCMTPPEVAEGDRRVCPGFGTHYGGVDVLAAKFATQLARLPGAGRHLAWGVRAAACLQPLGMGWLLPGVAAATLCDLGFPVQAGAGLFQFCTAPGLLAQGLEMADQPVTAMPFLDASHYHIDPS